MRNQRGEGIISVMISIAILGVLIVTVVTLYQMYGNMMAKSLLRREADLLANRVRAVLAHRGHCKSALAGNTWDGVTDTPVTLQAGDGQILAQPGMSLAGGRLQVSEVFIRRFRVDANGDGVVDSLASSTNLILRSTDGTSDVTGYTGEVVLRFTLAGDASNQGALSERKAPVIALVDSTNVIQDCDINEESARYKNCTPTMATQDGHSCGAAPPLPHQPSDCEDYAYVGEIDARGEPICYCVWRCLTPIWHRLGRIRCTSNTSLNGLLACPPAATTPGPNPCYGQIGTHCYYKEDNRTSCGWLNRYGLHHSRCEAN